MSIEHSYEEGQSAHKNLKQDAHLEETWYSGKLINEYNLSADIILN